MAVIYKITSPSGRVYIGSTKMRMSARWGKHTSTYRIWKAGGKGYCSSFILFDESGEPNDCKCDILETIDDLSVLRVRERHWMDSVECVNKYRPHVTTEEAAAYQRGYSMKHYAAKRDKIRAKCAVKVTCECGAVHAHSSTTTHKRSAKHQAYLTSLSTAT